MEDREKQARFVANDLIESGCVMFNTQQPFTLTSGSRSPVYVDVRRLLSYPRHRESIVLQLSARVQQVDAFDVIAGGETAGIPFAAWVAAKRRLPMIYVRKEPKAGGRRSQIEGMLETELLDQRVALIEDLASEGTSKVNFVTAIREHGGVVEHCFVVFNYGIFPGTQDLLDKLGVRLHALATWTDVLEAANAIKHFTAAEYDDISTYLANPTRWQANFS